MTGQEAVARWVLERREATIAVVPWEQRPDFEWPLVDALSEYVEAWWLPVLGPTSISFLRLAARGFVTTKNVGFQIDVERLAFKLGAPIPGVAKRLQNAAVPRAIGRLVVHGLAEIRVGELEGIAVRRAIPRAPTSRWSDRDKAAEATAWADAPKVYDPIFDGERAP